jgi:hypothetical protein
MLNRGAFRIISLALALALFGVAAIYNADARDTPRPPEPKRPPQRQDAGERVFYSRRAILLIRSEIERVASDYWLSG